MLLTIADEESWPTAHSFSSLQIEHMLKQLVFQGTSLRILELKNDTLAARGARMTSLVRPGRLQRLRFLKISCLVEKHFSCIGS